MEAESSLKCLYLSTQTPRRQNSEDRDHQTHQPDENIISNRKNKIEDVFTRNLHVTGPPLVGCP